MHTRKEITFTATGVGLEGEGSQGGEPLEGCREGRGGENEGSALYRWPHPWSTKDRWGQARGGSVLFCPGLGTLEPWEGLWSWFGCQVVTSYLLRTQIRTQAMHS